MQTATLLPQVEQKELRIDFGSDLNPINAFDGHAVAGCKMHLSCVYLSLDQLDPGAATGENESTSAGD